MTIESLSILDILSLKHDCESKRIGFMVIMCNIALYGSEAETREIALQECASFIRERDEKELQKKRNLEWFAFQSLAI